MYPQSESSTRFLWSILDEQPIAIAELIYSIPSFALHLHVRGVLIYPQIELYKSPAAVGAYLLDSPLLGRYQGPSLRFDVRNRLSICLSE